MGEFKWQPQNSQVKTKHGLTPMQLAKALVKKELRHRQFKLNAVVVEKSDNEEHLNWTQYPLPETELLVLIATITGETNHDLWINAKSTMATTIQVEINQQKEDLPLLEQVPKEYHEYLDVFDENKAD